MAAADPCRGLLTRYPANSPERAAQIAACTEKKRKAQLKQAAKKKAPTTTTTPQGKGAPGEKVWGTLSDLAKNGLPG